MIVELALATDTAPNDWRMEDDRTIATALDLLQERVKESKRRR